jgi:hypothetical protein
VAAVPGVPYSAAYGRKCLARNAHPYHILVANTAMTAASYSDIDDVGEPDDPLSRTADWWQQMVTDTLKALEIDREEFDSDVTQALLDLNNKEEE